MSLLNIANIYQGKIEIVILIQIRDNIYGNFDGGINL